MTTKTADATWDAFIVPLKRFYRKGSGNPPGRGSIIRNYLICGYGLNGDVFGTATAEHLAAAVRKHGHPHGLTERGYRLVPNNGEGETQ